MTTSTIGAASEQKRRALSLMEAENEPNILEPFELHYSDLLLLSSSDLILPSLSSSSNEIKRLQAVAGAVMENLGPSGPGLISITGVSDVSIIRNTLLPHARNLALLHNDERKRILKEHKLGSDVPLKNLDRCVSSFTMQLRYGDALESGTLSDLSSKGDENHSTVKLGESMDNQFKDMGSNFRELGYYMMDIGLRLARICDKAMGSQELERSLVESGTAKCRLIHYHSFLDTLLIKEAAGGRNTAEKGQKPQHNGSVDRECFLSEQMHEAGDGINRSEKCSGLWQQWHYDYGVFTVLTSPMFLDSCSRGVESVVKCNLNSFEVRCSSPSRHSYLQIFNPNENEIQTIKAPPESFIVQVGEAADVLSKGKLRSTLHSVSRPADLQNLSRETFVVFLQPAWNKIFDTTDYFMERLRLNDHTSGESDGGAGPASTKQQTCDINKIVPPLSSRLKNGMTFAEFARETTKQYYGGRG